MHVAMHHIILKTDNVKNVKRCDSMHGKLMLDEI